MYLLGCDHCKRSLQEGPGRPNWVKKEAVYCETCQGYMERVENAVAIERERKTLKAYEDIESFRLQKMEELMPPQITSR